MFRLVGALLTSILLAAASPAVAQAPSHTASDHTVTNPADGTTIAITVFQPGPAGPDSQAPVIFHSHGWGGTRSSSIDGDIQSFLDAGFGVVSIDQRGHGQSSGQANVQDPTMETEDIKAVIDFVASLDWVLKNTDQSGDPIADDPVLGAIGGSYGGGYQTMTALDEIADEGRTRFDALAPEITWYDLNESLAPQKVVRTAWTALLYAAGAGMLPQYVHEAFAWGAASGQWPDGTVFDTPAPGVPDLHSEFHKHGPVYFVDQDIRLDVPVLLRQGTSDNLFNLNQGLHIFNRALTEEARSRSLFVAFNGGHALPNAVPPGEPTALELGGGADACSENWTALRINFFARAFAGEDPSTLLPARYNLTGLDSATCFHTDGFDETTVEVDPLGTGSLATTTTFGAPLHLEVAQGPITVTGIPELSGLVTAGGIDSRAFFGLSVGTSPATARVVQNNLMPLRQVMPAIDEEFDIELPGVVVDVPEGQTLFLTISPFSDMSFGHGSRAPGALTLSDVVLRLPTPGAGSDDPVDPDEPRASALTLVREGQGDSAHLLATLTDAGSGAGVAGAEITFSSSGTNLGSAVTDEHGVARLALQGRYRAPNNSYEAGFAGNDDYEGSTASTG